MRKVYRGADKMHKLHIDVLDTPDWLIHSDSIVDTLSLCVVEVPSVRMRMNFADPWFSLLRSLRLSHGMSGPAFASTPITTITDLHIMLSPHTISEMTLIAQPEFAALQHATFTLSADVYEDSQIGAIFNYLYNTAQSLQILTVKGEGKARAVEVGWPHSLISTEAFVALRRLTIPATSVMMMIFGGTSPERSNVSLRLENAPKVKQIELTISDANYNRLRTSFAAFRFFTEKFESFPELEAYIFTFDREELAKMRTEYRAKPLAMAQTSSGRRHAYHQVLQRDGREGWRCRSKYGDTMGVLRQLVRLYEEKLGRDVFLSVDVSDLRRCVLEEETLAMSEGEFLPSEGMLYRW